jgi:hypothetical protein
MTKYLPYLYFGGAIFLAISAYNQYSQDLDSYRLLFSFRTEDKFTFLLVRAAVVAIIFLFGIRAMKRAQQEK